MRKVLFFLPLLIAACVNQVEDPAAATDSRAKSASQIQPRPLFVSGKSRADLLNPGPVQTIAAGAQTFYFDTKGAVNGSFLLFNTAVTAQEFAAGALAGKCVAGASSLAGHTWNGATLLLDTVAGNATQFYTCDGANPNEPLSKTNKFARENLTGATGTSYYWVVLGYDKNGVLTQISGLERFTLP